LVIDLVTESAQTNYANYCLHPVTQSFRFQCRLFIYLTTSYR